MKFGMKFVKLNIAKILGEMDVIEAKQKDAIQRERDFLASCKENSPVQQRIDQSRKSTQNKQPLEK